MTWQEGQRTPPIVCMILYFYPVIQGKFNPVQRLQTHKKYEITYFHFSDTPKQYCSRNNQTRNSATQQRDLNHFSSFRLSKLMASLPSAVVGNTLKLDPDFKRHIPPSLTFDKVAMIFLHLIPLLYVNIVELMSIICLFC